MPPPVRFETHTSWPTQNLLLGALPEDELLRITELLQLVEMPLGSVLYESGSEMSHIYFPTTSIVSLLYVMSDGASAEIAVSGRDGVVGIPLFMGGGSTSSRAVVQSAGRGYRLPAGALRREFARGGELHKLALCYTQALLTQVAQTAVCNRHHDISRQLCRWLLLSLDLLDAPELRMTQELIANMLGVRREGVTAAAGKLQRAGIIKYYRGSIAILDRPRLEGRVCECYRVVKRETERLLPYLKRPPKVPGVFQSSVMARATGRYG